MPMPKQNGYTVEDIYALPEGTRAELVAGEMIAMAPPGRIHQGIVAYLIKVIGNYIDERGGGCHIYPAPFAVFLKSEECDDSYENYVEPDISVICEDEKLTGKGCKGAPDWIIEVVSPSSRKMDYYLKLSLYQMNGVREYWVVDPERGIVMVYDFAHMAPAALYRITDKIRGSVFDSLVIDLGSVKQ